MKVNGYNLVIRYGLAEYACPAPAGGLELDLVMKHTSLLVVSF